MVKKTLNNKSQPTTVAIKVNFEHLMTPDERALYMTVADIDKLKYKYKGAVYSWTDTSRKKALAFKKTMDSQCKSRLEAAVKGLDSSWEAFAILHYKDVKADSDDFFEPAFVKPHYHIYVWKADDKRFRLSTLLKKLGINFDKKLDKTFLKKRALETIDDKAACLMYATHDTPKAAAAGKAPYKIDEIITNTDLETIKKIRSDYKPIRRKKKLSDEDWEDRAKMAYELGTNAGDYDKWLKEVFTVKQRGQVSLIRVIHGEYISGLSHYMGYAQDLVRCSVLIYGAKGLGKSHSARMALQEVCGGSSIYLAKKGPGKYDELSPSSLAMLFDDITVTSAKNVFDNYPCSLYRRNSADRPWLGRYAVATTNGDPWSWILGAAGLGNRKRALRATRDYVEEKGLDFVDADASALEAGAGGLYADEIEDIQAIASRLYICTVDFEGNLVVKQSQRRGHDVEHDMLFASFRDAFEKSLKPYALKKLHESQAEGKEPINPMLKSSIATVPMLEDKKEHKKKPLDLVDEDLPF